MKDSEDSESDEETTDTQTEEDIEIDEVIDQTEEEGEKENSEGPNVEATNSQKMLSSRTLKGSIQNSAWWARD